MVVCVTSRTARNDTPRNSGRQASKQAGKQAGRQAASQLTEVAGWDGISGAARGDGDADDGGQQVVVGCLAVSEWVLLRPSVTSCPVDVVRRGRLDHKRQQIKKRGGGGVGEERDESTSELVRQNPHSFTPTWRQKYSQR